MSVPSRRLGLRRLVECAVLIAIGTVLSLFEFSGPWALGGGITVCSMLPLVLICHRHGTKWGICSALVYGVLQMFLGMKNVMYGRNFWEVLAIILLDYVVAFGVIGLAGIFDKCIKNRPVSIAVGSVFATLLRLPLRVRLDHRGGPVAERAGLGFAAVVPCLQRQLHDPRNDHHDGRRRRPVLPAEEVLLR